MKFVRTTLDDRPEAPRFLDPLPYVNILPEISPQLPLGAREFANDPDHYNFVGCTRCVKDLRLRSVYAHENVNAEEVGLEISFKPNPFKHDDGLLIRYSGVVRLHVSADPPDTDPDFFYPEGRRLGDVEIDEILPTPDGGCTHEIKLTAGTIFVECRDLVAVWRNLS